MNKTAFLKLSSGMLILAVLFTPNNTEVWKYFFIPGIIFGIWWFIKLE